MAKLHSTIRKFPALVVVPLLAATPFIVVDLPKLDLWLSTLLYNESAGRWSLASLPLFDYSNRYFERTFVVAGALASLACIAVHYVVRRSSHWRRVGAGRVVAGRHYPSDVLWPGHLVFSVNGLIAYLWLRLPRHPLSHRAGS